ncbi:MAG: SIMPL domain-containing protein [Anaerolineae bacterium]|nr:SIMPL domain-containing protein [Anaerolineae bacterium]
MKVLQRIAFFAGIIGLLAGLTGVAAAQDYPPGTLTVEGYGQAFGAPDIALVQLGVQTSSSDVLEAYNTANDAVQNVIAALTDAGIDLKDIQTTGLYLYQDTPYNPQTGEPSTAPIYRVTNSLNVTVRDVAQVGDVINTGVQAGANNINGLTFNIADPAALEEQAREVAVADARARAEQLAGLMGVQLGEATIIVETPNAQPPMLYDRAQSAMGGGAAVQEGQLQVSVLVRVTFNIQ